MNVQSKEQIVVYELVTCPASNGFKIYISFDNWHIPFNLNKKEAQELYDELGAFLTGVK